MWEAKLVVRPARRIEKAGIQYNIQKTKFCPKCQANKPLGDFGINLKRKDGVQCYCKKCVVLRTKIWRAKNHELYAAQAESRKAYQQVYRKQNKDALLTKRRIYRGINACHLKEAYRKYSQCPTVRSHRLVLAKLDRDRLADSYLNKLAASRLSVSMKDLVYAPKEEIDSLKENVKQEIKVKRLIKAKLKPQTHE